ncbi:hypothetical protein OK074_8758 [Actinobacteria bacterium OK074]|nr:hypothetical protein OK074_8758 [Actinobacteria bacterium OK074]
MTYATAHAGGGRFDAEGVTVLDRGGEYETGSRQPDAGTAWFAGGGGCPGCGHGSQRHFCLFLSLG